MHMCPSPLRSPSLILKMQSFLLKVGEQDAALLEQKQIFDEKRAKPKMVPVGNAAPVYSSVAMRSSVLQWYARILSAGSERFSYLRSTEFRDQNGPRS